MQTDLGSAFTAGQEKLTASTSWQKLGEDPVASASPASSLAPPPVESFASDDEILAALRARSLADRRNLLEAVPQRFNLALEEVTRRMEPKAQRVSLPGGTITSTLELDSWIQQVRQIVEAKLQEGPVIL